MKNLFPSVCTFHAFFFLLLVSVKSDVIEKSCAKIVKSDPNVKFDFCVASLKENPKSRNAIRTRVLVPIAIEMAISNATAIGEIIAELLENKCFKGNATPCLEDCSEVYSDAGSDLHRALNAFRSRDFGTVKTVLSATLDSPTTCEDGFKDKNGLVSPLTKENNDFYQLALIPLSFVNILPSRVC